MYNPRFARRASRLILPVPEESSESKTESRVESRTESRSESRAPSVDEQSSVHQSSSSSVPPTPPRLIAAGAPMVTTSRAERVSEFVSEATKDVGAKFAELEERHNSEKQLLNSRIQTLETDLARAREWYDRGWPVQRGRWAEFDSFMTEVKILREENSKLRNLTAEELQIAERVQLDKLNREISSLRAENAKLFQQLNAMRDAHLIHSTPPSDFRGGIPRIPLEIPVIEKDRVDQVLREEWERSVAISRHGKGAPLKNPFEKRQYPLH
jgi:hypothetical protein